MMIVVMIVVFRRISWSMAPLPVGQNPNNAKIKTKTNQNLQYVLNDDLSRILRQRKKKPKSFAIQISNLFH